MLIKGAKMFGWYWKSGWRKGRRRRMRRRFLWYPYQAPITSRLAYWQVPWVERPRMEKPRIESPEIMEKAERIYRLLPKRDCGACGYNSCYDCAIAIASKRAPANACRIVGDEIEEEVKKIVGKYPY
ncbi:hypothetical protein B6U96_14780 [Archaeoglobales archaeon ex4484_92]|nr:MAG: hypothetical protein B6U96_14780 [Archaeoglobales archaeon ex4484_92]